jgi:hypothetical protein
VTPDQQTAARKVLCQADSELARGRRLLREVVPTLPPEYRKWFPAGYGGDEEEP